MNKTLRIIGDAHGMVKQHNEIALDSNYSVQLGDMGFSYKDLDELHSDHHKFFGGNHDNYDLYDNNPYSLGDSGSVTLGGVKFFFIRGAFSIDKEARLQSEVFGGPKVWWNKEQLGQYNRLLALESYQHEKPDIVITHTCPNQVAKLIGNPKVLASYGFEPTTFTTPTQRLLQECFDYWQPKLWVYGHFHMSRSDTIGNTKFVCLPELGYIDIDSKGNVL